jgi:acetyl-CoA C-acetyltransferase
MKEVYVVSYGRTAIGSLGGSLASIKGVELGSKAIKGVLDKVNISGEEVEEVIMGNVLQANNGQAPARQAALGAGIGINASCTTINKVCASGLKSIALASQSIQLGISQSVIAGGFESMSNAPYYIPNARSGYKYGNGEIIDGIVKDGLQDPFKKYMMGNIAEICAAKYGCSREAQDQYAIESYTRAQNAYQNNAFSDEIIPVEIPQRSGDPKIVNEDDEYKNLRLDKVASLKPAFDKAGTVTAFNASKINDGGAALLLVSKEKMEQLGLKPIAKVVGYADAEQDPDWFTTTPSLAIPKALKNAGLSIEDIDYFEINEAFSVVSIVNNQLLNISSDKVNVYGGAVALGHPIGASGARIACTLLTVLKQKKAKYGMAAICNGGGGASAIVFENIL